MSKYKLKIAYLYLFGYIFRANLTFRKKHADKWNPIYNYIF